MADAKPPPNPDDHDQEPATAGKADGTVTRTVNVPRDEIKRRDQAYQRQRSRADNAKARVQQRRMSQKQGRGR